MPRAYPERNPFPHQGTLSIEALKTSAQPGSDVQALPTLMLDPVIRLRGYSVRYLASFTTSGGRSGLPVNLSGGHGAGKTHTIRYIMDQFASKKLHPGEGILEPFVVYAKAEDPDFLKVYSQIMHQVPLELLADVSLRLLGVVAGEKIGQVLSDPKVAQRAVELLRTEPEEVNRLFDRYLVPQDTVRKELADEVYKASGEVRDFELAYTYLLHPELSHSAHAWLLGKQIGEAEMRGLGLTRLLDTPDLARRSLLLLATLFGRVSRPFILFLDQYEKLVLTQDPVLSESNIGLMRELVDALPGKGVMFVMAGSNHAWKALTVDLRQRFAGNVIKFPVLTLEEAKHLVRLYVAASTQHILQVWDAPDQEPVSELGGNALPIRCLAISNDERLVVTASEDTSLKVWDLQKSEEVRSLRGHTGPVNAVVITPDSRTAVSASDDGTLRIWDLETGKERMAPLHGHTNWVNALALTPDGRSVISGSTDATARLWDIETGRALNRFEGHIDTIWDVTVSPDGKHLLSASSDGSIGVWDLSSGRLLHWLRGHTSWVNQVCVTPDGRQAVSASDDGTVRVWDLQTGTPQGEPLTGHHEKVRALALSPDGKWAASSAVDQKIIIWDLPNREQRFSLQGTYSNSMALAYTPRTGRLIVSGQRPPDKLEEEDDLYPFTGDAIQEMLRYGVGNIRRLLQICFQVFDQAAFPDQEVIDAGLVQATLSRGNPLYFDRQMVQSQVELILGQQGFTFLREYNVGDTSVDLAVLSPDGSPRLLIEISEAIFRNDETSQALLNLNLVRTVQELHLDAQVLLVVLGYTSPDITPRLTEFVHNYIIYKDPETFAARFTELLKNLPAPAESAGRSEKVIKALEAGYDELRQRFEELSNISQREVANLQTNVNRYTLQQEREKFEARRVEVRQAWVQERRKIEEQIRQVRKDQRAKDIEELERLREQAMKSKRERQRLLGALYAVIALVALAIAFLYSSLSDLFYSINWYTILAASLSVAGVAAFLAVVYLFIGSDIVFSSLAWRELAGPVGSLDELDRLARSPDIRYRIKMNPVSSVLSEFILGFLFRKRSIGYLLRHSNPHYRYAGAINVLPDVNPRFLLDALLAERAIIVRRALAQQLVQNLHGGDLNRAIEELGREPTNALLVEAAALRAELDVRLLQHLPDSLKTLAMLAGDKSYFTELDTAFYSRSAGGREQLPLLLSAALKSPLHAEPIDNLAQAFRSGLDRVTHPSLNQITEYQVRAAIAELSPFEEDGLGTYDVLRIIEQIDQLYLFFRQLLFYMEQDVLVEPEILSAPGY